MGIVDPTQNQVSEVDQLDKELEADIPEKYRGKSTKDLIEMHAKTEKDLSRLGQEVGQLRKMALERPQEVVKEPVKKEVKVDDLLENPEDAVNTLVNQNAIVKKINSTVDDLERDLNRRTFESKHPQYAEDLKDEAFGEWIAKNPLRRALAEAADKYDFQAADSLWDMWQERKDLVSEAEQAKQVKKEEKRKAALKAGTLESGNGSPTESSKVWSRQEIRAIKEQALLGNRKAMATVNDPKWQAEVLAAYVEKRAK
jgi:hypothetical protein